MAKAEIFPLKNRAQHLHLTGIKSKTSQIKSSSYKEHIKTIILSKVKVPAKAETGMRNFHV
jgi:hypothetical protein